MNWQVLETDPETTSTCRRKPDFPPAFNWYSSEGVLGIQRTTEYTASRLGFCFFCRRREPNSERDAHPWGAHAPQQN